MLTPNGNYRNLKDSYLFFGISKKVAAYRAAHPDLPIYRLGIGDVSRPLCDAVIRALHEAVEDQAKFRLSLQNRDLVLEAVPGFLLDRMKKPEVRAVFASTAETVLGYPVAVRLAELSHDRRSVRDLNELKQFKEVTFVT